MTLHVAKAPYTIIHVLSIQTNQTNKPSGAVCMFFVSKITQKVMLDLGDILYLRNCSSAMGQGSHFGVDITVLQDLIATQAKSKCYYWKQLNYLLDGSGLGGIVMS